MASTTRQGAQRLGVTERQVQRYVHAGLLEARQFGEHATAPWMITDESLERLERIGSVGHCGDDQTGWGPS